MFLFALLAMYVGSWLLAVMFCRLARCSLVLVYIAVVFKVQVQVQAKKLLLSVQGRSGPATYFA